MFEQLIEKYSATNEDFKLRDSELTELIEEAKQAGSTHTAVWIKFKDVLVNKTNLSKTSAASLYRKTRITADLCEEVYSVEEFVPAFLKSRGHVMDYSGSFGHRDQNFVMNQMVLWSGQIVGSKPVYAERLIQAAFQQWQTSEKERLLAKSYVSIMHDPSADKMAIRRFAELIVAKTGDADRDELVIRATTTTLTNFIFRTKNHIRGRWHHASHLMPVLFGVQGSGKTTAVNHLLKPLMDAMMVAKVGGDQFGHDGKMMQLATMPIMFFDELAGFDKAQIERIKDVMLADRRELRALYGQPVTKTLMSTFIGCTNRELNTVIRDETGNRRFFQIDTPDRIDLEALKAIDVLAMWQSVDEDGDAPMYANSADLAAIQTIQTEQRFKSEVEEWLAIDHEVSSEWQTSPTLFADYFAPWFNVMYPNQSQFQSQRKFANELARLHREGHPRLTCKNGKSSKLWSIQKIDAEMKRDFKVIRGNRMAANDQVG